MGIPGRVTSRSGRRTRRLLPAGRRLPAGAVLAGLVVLAATAPASAVTRAGLAAEASARGTSGASATPGTQLWAARFNGLANGLDAASAEAVSPDGSTVFVTGRSDGTSTGPDYATIAYNAATGAKLWESRYNGPGNSVDEPDSLVVSPDGNTVFVTGESGGLGTGEDFATIAYNAATGAQLWLARYNSVGEDDDIAFSAAVSPDGSTVFVTGTGDQGLTYITIAYSAATGAQVWLADYNGTSRGLNEARSVAVSPDGSTVFVTGTSAGGIAGDDYATVAYDAATGTQLWAARYNGPGHGDDEAASVAVSPGGTAVFVTGYSTGATSQQDYATVAYAAGTGARLWVRRYNGPGDSSAEAAAVRVSPSGDTVFVTGYSYGVRSQQDYATLAYDAATGATQWVSRYNGPGNSDDLATALAVSPDGSTVYVTGGSVARVTGFDYATIAYSAASGARLWLARYNGFRSNDDMASAIAVSPDGSAVFVTGASVGARSQQDYATVGYSG